MNVNQFQESLKGDRKVWKHVKRSLRSISGDLVHINEMVACSGVSMPYLSNELERTREVEQTFVSSLLTQKVRGSTIGNLVGDVVNLKCSTSKGNDVYQVSKIFRIEKSSTVLKVVNRRCVFR